LPPPRDRISLAIGACTRWPRRRWFIESGRQRELDQGRVLAETPRDLMSGHAEAADKGKISVISAVRWRRRR